MTLVGISVCSRYVTLLLTHLSWVCLYCVYFTLHISEVISVEETKVQNKILFLFLSEVWCSGLSNANNVFYFKLQRTFIGGMFSFCNPFLFLDFFCWQRF